jgi:hypothetical protein
MSEVLTWLSIGFAFGFAASYAMSLVMYAIVRRRMRYLRRHPYIRKM